MLLTRGFLFVSCSWKLWRPLESYLTYLLMKGNQQGCACHTVLNGVKICIDIIHFNLLQVVCCIKIVIHVSLTNICVCVCVSGRYPPINKCARRMLFPLDNCIYFRLAMWRIFCWLLSKAWPVSMCTCREVHKSAYLTPAQLCGCGLPSGLSVCRIWVKGQD